MAQATRCRARSSADRCTGYLGYDAGLVDEIGEGVTDLSVGDEVLGLGQNTQAENAVPNAWAAKPPSVDR